MLKTRCFRLFAVVLFAGIILAAATISAHAADTRRVINVVYDNSGSMYKIIGTDKPLDTWSQALYAMETFATMLGPEDEMNIFLMSDNGANPINIKGSDSNRIAKIKASVTDTGGTPFETVEAAGEALRPTDPDTEYWLVVLTDGDFYQDNNSVQVDPDVVRSTIYNYADLEHNENVVYLAIGPDARTISGDNLHGFFCYHAKSSQEILGYITTIANQIFKQQIVPAGHIQKSGNKLTMNIDIPVTQILVFAQGKDIAVDSLTINSKDISATENHYVGVVLADAPLKYRDETQAAPGLEGVVQSYNAGSKPYEKGTYELTVSDTSNVEIYYIPGVDIDCVLLDENGVEVTSDQSHYAGIYGIDMRFVDRNTGEPVTSDLLQDAVFLATLQNAGRELPINSSVTSVQLEEGDAVLDAYAVLPGNVVVTSSHTYSVYPEPLRLDLSVEVPGEGYRLSALGKKTNPIIVTATDHKTGETISKDLWKQIDAEGVTVTSTCEEGSVNWIVTRGKDVSTWEIRPEYITDISDTGYGSVSLSFSVDYNGEPKSAHGSGNASTYIQGYTNSELKIDIEVPEATTEAAAVIGKEDGSAQEWESSGDTPAGAPDDSDADELSGKAANLHLGSLRNESDVMFRIYTKDEETGNYLPLTQQQFDNLEFDFECKDSLDGQDSKLRWKLTPTGEHGVFALTLDMLDAEKTAYSLRHIDKVVTVDIDASGELQDDLFIYQGSADTLITVHTMTLAELFSRIGAYVIGGAVFLFVLLGHLFKRKLRWKRFRPYAEDIATGNRIYVPKKRVWPSYILPWVPQRAKIRVQVPALNCRFADLHIKAAGAGQFYVVNINDYINNLITLNGTHVDLNAGRRRYTGVTLQYLDGMQNPIGRAHT